MAIGVLLSSLSMRKTCEVELKMDRSDLLDVFPFWAGVKEIGFLF